MGLRGSDFLVEQENRIGIATDLVEKERGVWTDVLGWTMNGREFLSRRGAAVVTIGDSSSPRSSSRPCNHTDIPLP